MSTNSLKTSSRPADAARPTRRLTMQQALNEALRQEMRRDETVFLLGEDIGTYGGLFEVTKGLLAEFGDRRVVETPVAEQLIAGAAAGAAIAGLRPVAEISQMDFITLALDGIVNHGAMMRYGTGGQISVPMVIRVAGGSHHVGPQMAKSLEAWLAHVPGLKVVMPSTPYDAKGLLIAAIRDPDPVIFVEHKLTYRTAGEVPEDEYVVEIGVADVKRAGTDVTVVATSHMVEEALQAADELADEISLEVIDPRTVAPLDIDAILESVRKTGRLLVVHEAWTRGGLGAEIIASVLDGGGYDHLTTRPRRLGAADVPSPFSPALQRLSIPDSGRIVAEARAMMA